MTGSEITTTREAPLATAPALNLQAAIESATALGKDGVEVLERLHALQKDERAADAKAAFVSAMANLRAELPHVEKTVAGQHGIKREGTRTKGMYAPLDTIAKVCDPFISEHGFSYRFSRRVVEGREHDYIVCTVTHRAGHEEESLYPAPSGDTNRGTNKLQATAVGETYAKRYALIAAFGITTADPDEDGNVQDGPAQGGAALTDEQMLEIESLMDTAGADTARFLSYFGVERLSEVPAERFGECVSMLRAKIRKAQA